MQHRVLRSADIQIDPRCGIVAGRAHPVTLRFVADKAVVVLRVEIAQIVPATAGPLRHGVGLSLLAVAGLAPFLGAGQGRVAGAGRLEIGEIRRREWQVAFAQAKVAALIPNDRKRLAPVALPAEQPIAQFVIDRPLSKRFRLKPSGRFRLGLGGWQAIEKTGVHRNAHAGEAKRLFAFRRLDDNLDRQLEFLRKLQIARVVCRYCHDRARPVPGQNVVCCPNRHLPAVDRIDRVRAGEHAAFVLGQVGSLKVALLRRLGLICLDLGLVFGGNNLPEQLALRRHDHVRRAEQRVRPRGENGDLDVGIFDAEKHLRTLRAADPVALHFLERLAPVDAVEVVEQPLRVLGDSQHPLLHRPTNDREAADLAQAVLDLLVGQDGAKLGAPVHRRVAHVSQAMVVAPSAALLVGGDIQRIRQRVDRLRLVRRRIEPRVVKLQENPLRPAEVSGVGGVHLAAPVVTEAKRPNLPLEIGDIRLGGDARVLAGLDGVLFRRQAKRVPADRVQHVEAAHALVAGENVGGRVALRMPNVQPGARRVRKHVEDVIFRDVAGVRVRVALGKRMIGGDAFAGVPRPERLAVMPMLLPLRLKNLERILSAHSCG